MKKEQRKKDGGMPMCDSKVWGKKVRGVYGKDGGYIYQFTFSEKTEGENNKSLNTHHCFFILSYQPKF